MKRGEVTWHDAGLYRPPENGFYLVYVSEGRRIKTAQWFDGVWKSISQVTHWTQLPAPPKYAGTTV